MLTRRAAVLCVFLYHVAVDNTDVGTSSPSDRIWTLWLREERAPRQLASTFPATLGEAAQARGAFGRALHFYSRCRVSICYGIRLMAAAPRTYFHHFVCAAVSTAERSTPKNKLLYIRVRNIQYVLV